MILNTGNRTDIPSYYSEWFCNRIQAGYVYVRNPYYDHLVMKYILDPSLIDLINFCTKDPYPMLSKLDVIKDYAQYWFVTITPYGKEIEPNLRDKKEIMDSFKALSLSIGKKHICWRYDPIFITEKYSLEYHIQRFEEMCSYLKGYTEYCVISFLDLYEKTIKNFPEGNAVTNKEAEILVKEFVMIGEKYDIRIKLCCEGKEYNKLGVYPDGCMTKSFAEKILGCQLEIPSKGKSREGCTCLLGNDIGAYNTCGHGCKYCYANYGSVLISV